MEPQLSFLGSLARGKGRPRCAERALGAGRGCRPESLPCCLSPGHPLICETETPVSVLASAQGVGSSYEVLTGWDSHGSSGDPKLQCACESMGILLDYDHAGLGWGLRLRISHKLPSHADSGSLWTTL